MDIKDLKSAWDNYSSKEMDKHMLEQESITELLKNKTKTLIERIDRNINIGLILILIYIAYIIVNDLFIADLLLKKSPVEYPDWMTPLDIFSNVLIICTYIYFAISYFKAKKHFSPDNQLKNFLSGIIKTINTYRRLFYLAVIILLINITVSFSAGLYEGIKYQANLKTGGLENLSNSKIVVIILVGLAFLIPIVLATYFVFRWGFNKLYGNYLLKLNQTYKELDEPETLEN